MPSVTDYIGAVTGAVGMVAGIYSLVRTHKIKSLDLRLELRTTVADVHLALATARGLLALGDQSRQRVLAARGQVGSGAMTGWRQSVEQDQAELDKLAAAARSEDADFTALSQEQLESEVVAARKARARLAELIEKYRAAYADDDQRRREIRQDARDDVNRQLGRS
ncbi:kinetochore Spc7 family protein [Burkholderia pseudomallei]|uniref:hypothetical protein n=1 Tax=Burkholderia pseudomallei TaxID=28450 RepID=UPI00053716CB|nr:hypothetical protein [Burkholderia pseudomallei]KGX51346.1 hypothetical protein Y025_1325 [Burkholderia pseudomallei TSV32]